MWPLARRPGDLRQHQAIDAAAKSAPSLGLLARQCERHIKRLVVVSESRELLAIDHIVPATRRIQQPCRRLVSARARTSSPSRARPSSSRTERRSSSFSSGERVISATCAFQNCSGSAARSTSSAARRAMSLPPTVSGDARYLLRRQRRKKTCRQRCALGLGRRRRFGIHGWNDLPFNHDFKVRKNLTVSAGSGRIA